MKIRVYLLENSDKEFVLLEFRRAEIHMEYVDEYLINITAYGKDGTKFDIYTESMSYLQEHNCLVCYSAKHYGIYIHEEMIEKSF